MTRKKILLLIFCIVFIFSACIERPRSLGQQEALEIAWEALNPNTESHNRDDWEIDEARKVFGKDVVNEFAAMRFQDCPGPDIPENSPIKISSEYWYVSVIPQQKAIGKDQETGEALSATVNPEPRIDQASFLIDLYGGGVIARRLICQ